MAISSFAGKPAPKAMLLDLARLEHEAGGADGQTGLGGLGRCPHLPGQRQPNLSSLQIISVRDQGTPHRNRREAMHALQATTLGRRCSDPSV